MWKVSLTVPQELNFSLKLFKLISRFHLCFLLKYQGYDETLSFYNIWPWSIVFTNGLFNKSVITA